MSIGGSGWGTDETGHTGRETQQTESAPQTQREPGALRSALARAGEWLAAPVGGGKADAQGGPRYGQAGSRPAPVGEQSSFPFEAIGIVVILILMVIIVADKWPSISGAVGAGQAPAAPAAFGRIALATPTSSVRTIYVAHTGGNGVSVRSSMDMAATTTTVLPEGEAMALSVVRDGWALITKPAQGYIPPQYWSESPPPAVVSTTRYVSADGDGLFIRSKPDMEAKVKVWPDGTAVELLGQDGEWCNVRDPDGYVGYMPTRYLTAAKEPR